MYTLIDREGRLEAVKPDIAILSSLSSWQRVAIVALAIIPLILVTICSVPALIVLPFIPGGVNTMKMLISKLIVWTKIILSGSQIPSG